MADQPIQHNEVSPRRSCSCHDRGSQYSNDSADEEEYLPELDLPPELIADDIIRNSTVESYISDDDDDDDSSVTLFYAGYTGVAREDPTWDRQINEPVPMPVRKPVSRRDVISRAPTFEKPASVLSSDNFNLVTWGPDDPANPHNWPKHRRWTSTVLIAVFAFIAPMASTMVRDWKV